MGPPGMGGLGGLLRRWEPDREWRAGGTLRPWQAKSDRPSGEPVQGDQGVEGGGGLLRRWEPDRQRRRGWNGAAVAAGLERSHRPDQRLSARAPEPAQLQHNNPSTEREARGIGPPSPRLELAAISRLQAGSAGRLSPSGPWATAAGREPGGLSWWHAGGCRFERRGGHASAELALCFILRLIRATVLRRSSTKTLPS
jgi:hypothetical protein